MSISRFYDRNRPIFSIAAFLALVFVGLIVYYKIKPHKETTLSKVNRADEEFYKVAYDDYYQNTGLDLPEEYENNQPENEDQTNGNENLPSPSEQTVDEKYGILEIIYTTEGFSPRVTRARQGQTVKWTNNTDALITIHQRKQTYTEFSNDVEIKPGETFSIVLSELGIWTYEEKETRNFGSIEVKPVPNLTQ